MAPTVKKRAVISYENMSSELKAAFDEKYPRGFQDYLPDVMKYDKPNGTCFYAVTIEIPDAIYLVKINMKIDAAEDVERWLDNDDEGGEDEGGSSSSGGDNSGELPDDNIAQYSSDEDSQDA